MHLTQYDLSDPPRIDYDDAAKAIGIREDRIPPLVLKTEMTFEDVLATVTGEGGGMMAAFDHRTPPIGQMIVDLVTYDRTASIINSDPELRQLSPERAAEKGFAPLEQIIAHELIHAKQLQDWLDSGRSLTEWSAQVVKENTEATSYQAYRAIPDEADAFKRGPLFAHLVRITEG